MKTEPSSYAVFLFPQAIEALGAVIKPYTTEAPVGPHIVCSEVDASGAFFQLTVPGQDQHGALTNITARPERSAEGAKSKGPCFDSAALRSARTEPEGMLRATIRAPVSDA